MIVTLNNINYIQKDYSIIEKRRVMGTNQKTKYELLKKLTIQLSNGDIITIPKGFIWDGSSTPRFLWGLVPPEGDFELGALIHDYLYVKKKEFKYSRKFADDEMLIWSKKTSGRDHISIRNIDNYVRWFFVRVFGGLVWKNIIKIK